MALDFDAVKFGVGDDIINYRVVLRNRNPVIRVGYPSSGPDFGIGPITTSRAYHIRIRAEQRHAVWHAAYARRTSGKILSDTERNSVGYKYRESNRKPTEFSS